MKRVRKEEGRGLARRLRVDGGDVFLDLDMVEDRSDVFSSYTRPVNEPITISIYKPHEKKCKLLLELSLKELSLMHSKIDDAHVQVLLRIGQYGDGKILRDEVPDGVTVKISRLISLGKVQSPLDVAHYVGHWPSCRPLPLEVYWSPHLLRRSFHIKVDLLVVRNPQAFPLHLGTRLLGPEHALRKLREKSKWFGDSGVNVVNQEIPLLCPFTLRRIRTPAASSACEHIQCFDAETYFRMNLENPKWTCPFCRLLIYPNDIMVDGSVFPERRGSALLRDSVHRSSMRGVEDGVGLGNYMEYLKSGEKRRDPLNCERGRQKSSDHASRPKLAAAIENLELARLEMEREEREAEERRKKDDAILAAMENEVLRLRHRAGRTGAASSDSVYDRSVKCASADRRVEVLPGGGCQEKCVEVKLFEYGLSNLSNEEYVAVERISDEIDVFEDPCYKIDSDLRMNKACDQEENFEDCMADEFNEDDRAQISEVDNFKDILSDVSQEEDIAVHNRTGEICLMEGLCFKIESDERIEEACDQEDNFEDCLTYIINKNVGTKTAEMGVFVEIKNCVTNYIFMKTEAGETGPSENARTLREDEKIEILSVDKSEEECVADQIVVHRSRDVISEVVDEFRDMIACYFGKIVNCPGKSNQGCTDIGRNSRKGKCQIRGKNWKYRKKKINKWKTSEYHPYPQRDTF